jgi:hypothetical protein
MRPLLLGNNRGSPKVAQFVKAKENLNPRPEIAEEEVTGGCASIMDRKGQLEKEDNEFIEIAIITLSVDFVHCLSISSR